MVSVAQDSTSSKQLPLPADFPCSMISVLCAMQPQKIRMVDKLGTFKSPRQANSWTMKERRRSVVEISYSAKLSSQFLPA